MLGQELSDPTIFNKRAAQIGHHRSTMGCLYSELVIMFTVSHLRGLKLVCCSLEQTTFKLHAQGKP